MMYGYGNGIGGWGYALMAISMILFWGAVIYGIVALVRYAPAGRTAPDIQRIPFWSLARRLRVVGHYRPLPGRASLQSDSAELPEPRSGARICGCGSGTGG